MSQKKKFMPSKNTSIGSPDSGDQRAAFCKKHTRVEGERQEACHPVAQTCRPVFPSFLLKILVTQR